MLRYKLINDEKNLLQVTEAVSEASAPNPCYPILWRTLALNHATAGSSFLSKEELASICQQTKDKQLFK